MEKRIFLIALVVGVVCVFSQVEAGKNPWIEGIKVACKDQCGRILGSKQSCTSDITDDNEKVYNSACNSNCFPPRIRGKNPGDDEVLTAICKNKKVLELQAKTSENENEKIGLNAFENVKGLNNDHEYARKSFNPRRFDALEMLRRRDALENLRRRDWEKREYQREMAFRRRQDALESLRRNRDSDMTVQEKMAMRRNDAYNKDAKVPTWMLRDAYNKDAKVPAWIERDAYNKDAKVPKWYRKDYIN